MTVKQKLADLGLRLPEPPEPRGEYVPVIVHGNTLYVSGQVSREGAGVILGPVSKDTGEDIISRAAEACVLRTLSALEHSVGLDRVDRLLFLRGYVYAEDEYYQYSKVVDAASRLLLKLFGDKGQHARLAVGVAGLPSGGMLEIEVTAALA